MFKSAFFATMNAAATKLFQDIVGLRTPSLIEWDAEGLNRSITVCASALANVDSCCARKETEFINTTWLLIAINHQNFDAVIELLKAGACFARDDDLHDDLLHLLIGLPIVDQVSFIFIDFLIRTLQWDHWRDWFVSRRRRQLCFGDAWARRLRVFLERQQFHIATIVWIFIQFYCLDCPVDKGFWTNDLIYCFEREASIFECIHSENNRMLFSCRKYTITKTMKSLRNIAIALLPIELPPAVLAEILTIIAKDMMSVEIDFARKHHKLTPALLDELLYLFKKPANAFGHTSLSWGAFYERSGLLLSCRRRLLEQRATCAYIIGQRT